MKDKLVSIIIPVYNTENYINICVKSIVAQTYSNIQIILVDDGSTDASAKLCDDWATKDKRIFVLHQRNSGVSAARNSGIEYASGKWIMFVDADDIIVHAPYIINLANRSSEEKWQFSIEFLKKEPVIIQILTSSF